MFLYPQIHCQAVLQVKGIVCHGAVLLSVPGEKWLVLGRAWTGQSRRSEDGPEGCSRQRTRDHILGSSWGAWGGRANRSLLHVCGTGDELQMYHRSARCFVKLPQHSGFPQRPLVILSLVTFKEFWTWPSELKLMVPEGL